MVAYPKKRRFNVDEYYQMAEQGILGRDERVELIDGEIVTRCAIGSEHAGCVNRCVRLFVVGVRDRAIVSVQNPVRLSDFSEPEPDIALLRPREDDYTRSHPGPGDVFLIIEVADTSLGYDRGTKLPRYAEADIPEVWIVDLNGQHIEVYRDPQMDVYRTAAVYHGAEVVAPLAFPDIAIRCDRLLP